MASLKKICSAIAGVIRFYNNQISPAAIVGGHIDLNRTPRWVFRII